MVKSMDSYPIPWQVTNLSVPQFLAHKISVIIVHIDLTGLCKDKEINICKCYHSVPHVVLYK